MRGCFVIYAVLILFGAHGQDSQKYTYEQVQMGTLFRIIMYASDPVLAESVSDKAFSELDRLNGLLSDYDPTSEVSNVEGEKWIDVSDDLFHILEEAQAIRNLSGGALDVTCGKLTKLWRKGMRRQTLPDPVAIATNRESCGVEYDTRLEPTKQVKFQAVDFKLDLGAIAKGYALDRMAVILTESGIRSFLIDGGGDLILGEGPPDEPFSWSVMLNDGSMKYMQSCAIATSGPDFKFVDTNEGEYSHIIDPRTGWGILSPRSVTVIGSQAITCDAWATALTVMDDTEHADLMQSNALSAFEIIFYAKQ